MQNYRQLLKDSKTSLALVGMVLSTLTLTMISIALLLFIQGERSSFALAGAAVGALALLDALSSPWKGRLIDRQGHLVIVVMSLVQIITLLSILLFINSMTGLLLVLLSGLAGLFRAPISAAMRSVWPKITAKESLPRAYAFDSMVTASSFLFGPMLAAVLLLIAPPGVVVGAACLLVALGSVFFVRGVARIEIEMPEFEPSPLPAGVWIISLSTLCLGAVFGATEVAMVSAGEGIGQKALGAFVLGLWAGVEVIGSYRYGNKREHNPTKDHFFFTLALPLTLALAFLAFNPWLLLLLMLPSGYFIGPIFASRNQLLSQLVSRDRLTESFSLMLGALGVGVAAGVALGGVLVDHSSWQAALALATVAGLIGSAVTIPSYLKEKRPQSAG
jgi:MFS family permease